MQRKSISKASRSDSILDAAADSAFLTSLPDGVGSSSSHASRKGKPPTEVQAEGFNGAAMRDLQQSVQCDKFRYTVDKLIYEFEEKQRLASTGRKAAHQRRSAGGPASLLANPVLASAVGSGGAPPSSPRKDHTSIFLDGEGDAAENFERYCFYFCHLGEPSDRQKLLSWFARMQDYSRELQTMRNAPHLFSFTGDEEDEFDNSTGVAGLRVYRPKHKTKDGHNSNNLHHSHAKDDFFERLAASAKKRGRAALEVTEHRKEHIRGLAKAHVSFRRYDRKEQAVDFQGTPVTQDVEKRLFGVAQQTAMYSPRRPATARANTSRQAEVGGRGRGETSAAANDLGVATMSPTAPRRPRPSQPISSTCAFPRF